MIDMLHALGVFVAVFVLDILWALYIKRVGRGDRIKAANLAAVLYVLGAFVITEYVGNPWMLVPAVVGSWLGTYVGSKR